MEFTHFDLLAVFVIKMLEIIANVKFSCSKFLLLFMVFEGSSNSIFFLVNQFVLSGTTIRSLHFSPIPRVKKTVKG